MQEKMQMQYMVVSFSHKKVDIAMREKIKCERRKKLCHFCTRLMRVMRLERVFCFAPATAWSFM